MTRDWIFAPKCNIRLDKLILPGVCYIKRKEAAIVDMTEYVKQIMREEGITQCELASRVRWSRQRVFDILKRNNSNFNSVKTIMGALGRETVISRKDGKEPDFDMADFYSVIEENAPLYGKLEAILDAMGYKIEFVKK
jgi:hypothetical protein